MWIDLHHQFARERHEQLLREAEHGRVAAAAARPERRCRRLRLGRLQLCWNCARVARGPA